MKVRRQRATLYRGSKPVMWSVVEKTALAEAESRVRGLPPAIRSWVKFPVKGPLGGFTSRRASVVIWTTTPWTLPGNRAISYLVTRSATASTKSPMPLHDNWAKTGDLLILADKLLPKSVFKAAKVTAFVRRVRKSRNGPPGSPSSRWNARIHCCGLAGGYEFTVPLLDGDHVTDDTGTGFVHTAPRAWS